MLPQTEKQIIKRKRTNIFRKTRRSRDALMQG
jgi:hypothetical protein